MNRIAAQALRGERLADTFIVDFHVHLAGRWNGMNVPVHDSDEMVRRAEAVGVDRLVVFGSIYPDMAECNNMVAELSRRHSERVVGFATVNPYQNDMAEEARRGFDELGFRGVKVHEVHDNYHSLKPMMMYHQEWEELFSLLVDRKWPVVFHGLITEEMIRQWPEVTFVMAHGIASPTMMERLADCPNLLVDTAATTNPAWAVTRAVELLGPDRVVWGTDAPLDDFAQRLGVVLDSGLSEEDMLKVLGGNATRLLRLEQ